MPRSFFHLRFELYPSPAAGQPTKHRDIPQCTSHDVFVPPPGADIFRTSLPAHRSPEWDSYPYGRRPGDLDPTRFSGSDRTESPHREAVLEPPGDALLLPERTSNLKGPSRSAPALCLAKPSNKVAARDWRYGAVTIDSIDMEPRPAKSGQAKSAQNGLHTKALYLPSHAVTTDVGWGIVHLYRDTEEPSRVADDALAQRNAERAHGSSAEAFSLDDCTTLCILAVPSWMMPSDLLGFVGDQAREDVTHFRLVRTGRANKYMVLMKFRSAKKAREWHKTYNGRLFSAAEPENCHVVFIKTVEFVSPDKSSVDGGDVAASFPRNNQHDPFTRGKASNGLTSKPLAPPPPNLLELPTCPVCLERMDETTGLLTILCQHVFHCACLEKWRFSGSGCPVCRYTQSPSYTFPYPRPRDAEQDDSVAGCTVCAADVNLWICLICGNVGCGRYDSAHAYAHYESTSHCYAMDIDTQRVWDYAGDGYVHRLIQSKPFSDGAGKPSTGEQVLGAHDRDRHENEAYRAEGGDMVPREKMESMANEYTYLLTSQLEGQRRYFEEQVERAVDKATQATSRADEAMAQAERAQREMQNSRTSQQGLDDAAARMERQLDRSEKARARFEQMARDLSTALREEKAMNEGLLKRVHAADEKALAASASADKARTEMAELQEMNRDLTMFISSQEKVRDLQAQGEEVVDGSVSLPEQQQPKPGKKGRGRKK